MEEEKIETDVIPPRSEELPFGLDKSTVIGIMGLVGSVAGVGGVLYGVRMGNKRLVVKEK